MKNFKNKIVLITGASSGIGEACAEIFAQQGAKLILCARRKERIENLAIRFFKKYATKCYLMNLDIRNRKAVQANITNLPKNWQAIEVLINNAGLAAGLDKIQAADLDDWDCMIDTNIKGLLYMSHAVLPNMVKRNRGHIINIGSIAGHEVYTNGGVYCSTKHAVFALTKGLKLDLLGTKIRVSSVDPGMVETEFSEVRFKGDKERAKKVYTGLKPLSASDVADAVYYCASCPEHVNILEVIVLPTAQSAATAVHRQ